MNEDWERWDAANSKKAAIDGHSIHDVEKDNILRKTITKNNVHNQVFNDGQMGDNEVFMSNEVEQSLSYNCSINMRSQTLDMAGRGGAVEGQGVLDEQSDVESRRRGPLFVGPIQSGEEESRVRVAVSEGCVKSSQKRIVGGAESPFGRVMTRRGGGVWAAVRGPKEAVGLLLSLKNENFVFKK
jgi:hypothetical protein